MFDCGVTTCILTIIWFFSLLLIFTALNTGHWSGRLTLVIATVLSACVRLVPEDRLREYVGNFYRNVFLTYPATVISIVIGLFIAYVYLFNYIYSYDPPPSPVPPRKSKRPSETD